jgi:hypothetical protein
MHEFVFLSAIFVILSYCKEKIASVISQRLHDSFAEIFYRRDGAELLLFCFRNAKSPPKGGLLA